jgi:transcriptional regulator with XRE-family HTH domain
MQEMDEYDSTQLRSFLVRTRARISPQSVGLPADGRRFVPGLRRREVAELIGVSDDWYKRFECGRARLSIAALARLAAVLLLDADEKARLFALARPELRDSVLAEATGLREVQVIQRFLRELRHASDLSEIVVRTVRALNDAIKPTNTAYWVHQLDDDGNALFDCAEGPAAEAYIGLWQSADANAHERAAMLANARVCSESLALSPSAEFRQRIAKFNVRSYSSLGIGPVGDRWVAIGFANASSGTFAPITLASLDTIGEAARSALYNLRAQ